MKYKFWVTLLCCLPIFSVLAQSKFAIKGVVNDQTANVALLNASVSVLNVKDSTLVKFSRADQQGSFSISDLKAGKFILLVTYPKYADYVDRFSLDSAHQSVDLGKISMILKSRLLADVIIKGEVSAIKIKGDTTEYNAGSFKIPPNAKVEELLKQLPGIQVDKDGKITAQGETVTKVLVDGEEFFGDDPTLVTKNLRGDMIDKVQLYDKKSDQAAFTGIDDGIKTKTINLKLKEDKKNGYFGKVDGGGADDSYYQSQNMFNAFKPKRKVSAYATLANTGKTGLGWEDGNKYGATTPEVTDGGGIMITGGNDELRYNGEGIPSAQTGGAHYEGKWNKDKESLNTNFKIGRLAIDGEKSNISRNTLPAGGANLTATVFNNRGAETFNNYTFRQKLDATYQLKIDSTSNLKIIVDGSIRNTKVNENSSELNTLEDGTLQNTGNNFLTTDGKKQSLFTSIFYNKKLKKTGRTFSVTLSETINKYDSEGFQNSLNLFYKPTGVDTLTIDQYKVNIANSSAFNSNITYTEPFTKAFSVVLNYGLGITNSLSDRQSFNKNTAGRYEDLDENFSNNFELNQLSNQGGAIFNYKKKKTTLNFGTRIASVQFNQLDLRADSTRSRRFINLNPQASYQYKFSPQKSVRINYNGNTNQPSINQIQPVRNNARPLNISLGNPDLKPEFRNSLNANYHSYKVLTQQYIYANASYSLTLNSITSSSTRDSAGRSTSQSINLKGQNPSNFNFYGGASQKINALGFNLGMRVQISGNTYFNYLNTLLNKQQSTNYSGSLTAHNYVAKKYDFNLSVGPEYTINKASLQTGANTNATRFRADGSFTVYLPKKFEISSDFNYRLAKKTEQFNDDIGYFIWNTSVSRKFLKDESLTFSVKGNDLLNQNVGFNRYSSGNYVSQNTFTTIKRYFMFSLVWDFNKMGGGLKAKN